MALFDGYKKGYEKGRKDAKSLKGKDMRPPAKEAVVKGRRFTTTYIDGYKEGYRKGKKA